MSSNLGDRIVELRKRRGLSQGQLAIYADVEQSYLSMIESGKRTRVGSDIVSRLAAALRTSTDYLLGLVDNPFSSLADLSTLSPEESNEMKFRYGYVEGWSHAIEAFYSLMSGKEGDRESAYNLCLNHLEKVLQPWQRSNLDQTILPPLLSVEDAAKHGSVPQRPDPYQEILDVIWAMTPDELKERIVIRLQEAVEEHEREKAEREAPRESKETVEKDGSR